MIICAQDGLQSLHFMGTVQENHMKVMKYHENA
jgi:hypothetical protein